MVKECSKRREVHRLRERFQRTHYRNIIDPLADVDQFRLALKLKEKTGGVSSVNIAMPREKRSNKYEKGSGVTGGIFKAIWRTILLHVQYLYECCLFTSFLEDCQNSYAPEVISLLPTFGKVSEKN